jgi:nucleotide-binding universal stress UspA family protein
MSAPIMVPLDGSPAAEAALPWAVRLATATGGGLRLVGVHAPPAMVLDGEAVVGAVIPDQPIREEELKYFAGVQARLKALGMSVSAELLDGGVVSSLAGYAVTLRPAWIVMLSHARGALARFFLGETATEFLRRSPCPVLLVHETDTSADPKDVLIPLDGSPLAERMIGPAAEFARTIGADVTLLVAAADVRLPDPEAYLARHAATIRTANTIVKTRVVREGHAADAILSAAAPGTVVALATHGRGGLSKLVWGSVTDQVVHRAIGPVLVFKPTENDPAAGSATAVPGAS